MRVAVFALVFLALAAVSRAEAESKVVVLTESTFDDFVAKTPLALIEFYAPWCGHCKALTPEYDSAAHQLDGKEHGKLAKVDCTVEKDLCSKYEVQGFPTVKLFRNDGSSPSDYDGARKADDLVKFMIRQSSPAVSELADAEAVKNFAATESVRVVAFVGDENLDGYTKAANALRNEYFFGVVKGNAAANTEHKVTSTPAVVVLRNFDSGAVTYTGDFSDSDAIVKFIKFNAFPLVGEIGPENYAKYLERGYNFVWIFIEPENAAHTAMINDAIVPAATEFKELSFVKLDGVKWAEHAKSFGLSGNTPGIVLEDHEKRKNYVFPESETVTKDGFRTFIDGVLTGKISAHVKSEPEPADNTGPVKTVVGTSFDRIVLEDSKDVFVEFYAPWCGHCKSLAPKWEELGKSFASDDTVVIAKIDATANDSPADIQGFPTLILYPAGDKSNPVNYEGDRTVKAMAKFLRLNGKAGGRPSKDESADDAADADGEEQRDDSESAGGDESGGGDDEFDFGDFEELEGADFDDEGAAGDDEGADGEEQDQGSDHGHSHGDGDDHGHAHGDHDDEL